MPAEPMQTQPSASVGHPAGDDGAWEALMTRAQDGDCAAYQALLEAISPWLRTIVRRHLGHGEDTEDALQDILLVVHGIRHTYEPGRPFGPWLSTIANRRCIDLLRRRGHRQRYEPEADADVATYAADGPAPPDASAHAQAAHHLHRAVDALPERQREAVRLLRLQELSLHEAAERSGQSIGALKVACHRALKSLRQALQRDSRHD